MTRSEAARTGANLIPKPYTGEQEAEKVRPRFRDLLLREQVLSPDEPSRTLPGAVAVDRSLGVAHELDLDAPAPGGTAPDPALPPHPDDASSDDAMLRRLDATRQAAVAYLARTDGKR